MVYTVELKHVLITVRDWMLIPVILSISLLDPAKDPYLGLPCWAECASTSCVGRSCDFSAHGSCNAAGLLFSFMAPYSGEGGGGRRCPELDHSRVTANLSQGTCFSKRLTQSVSLATLSGSIQTRCCVVKEGERQNPGDYWT